MVYKNKGKFILDKEHLQQAVDEVLKHNGDVSVTIEESPVKNSKSLYLHISIDDCEVSLRVSDHKSKREARQIIVGKDTGAANVCYKIERAIRELRYKKLQSVIEGVGNGHKAGKSHRAGK